MRKVVLYHLQSLDGVGEEPGHWMSDSGPKIFDNLGTVIETQEDILLGRGTYDYWVGYWPNSDLEPFASFINSTPKHVFSGTPLSEEWANSTVVDRSATDYVADLKRGKGGDIGIHGSIDLSRSLLKADLVDELRLVVAPSLAGKGRKVFTGEDDGRLRKLELRESDVTDGGSLLLWYRFVGRAIPR
jgi:dihydrofolate reductase